MMTGMMMITPIMRWVGDARESEAPGAARPETTKLRISRQLMLRKLPGG